MKIKKNFHFELEDLVNKEDNVLKTLDVIIPEKVDPQHGMFVWPSAPVLSKFIFNNQENFRDKNVLELGAGTSLPGIVAAKIGAKVTLSDAKFYPNCLENCRQSCEVNNLKTSMVNVIPLTWGLVDEQILNLENVDAILGSDCFYDRKDFEDIIFTVSFLLNRNPSCVFITAYQVRSEKYCLQMLLKKWGLIGKEIPLKSFCTEDELVNHKHDIELYQITKA
ncbi:histone-arginine methyltransferase METTL23-like [Clytia hemisphaerica]|uniref:Uncharacterized protein n=1 Tax=Clytia hemisphaerica TaxID=252671 RepID=A0A7M5UG82_9CNID